MWEGRPHSRHTAVVTTMSQIAWDMVDRLLARAERSLAGRAMGLFWGCPLDRAVGSGRKLTVLCSEAATR